MADHINLTAAEQAAAQIEALINSRPTSPRKEEIAAIIAQGSLPTAHFGDCQISDLDARIRNLLPQMRAAEVEAGKLMDGTPEWKVADAKREQMYERLLVLEREVYAKPAVSMADVQTRATIAAFWGDNRDTVDVGHVGDGSGPIEGLDEKDVYERALARLLEAVLRVGGRRWSIPARARLERTRSWQSSPGFMPPTSPPGPIPTGPSGTRSANSVMRPGPKRSA